MPSLGAKERAGLPYSAFAYIDSRGRRSLPIHDAAHVRNALTRFSRVSFEDEAARDLARMRVLRAAKKLGIMPLGFVSAQLRPEQKFPRGHVTFLLTDIEGSTELRVDRGEVRSDPRPRARRCVQRLDPCEPQSGRPRTARARPRGRRGSRGGRPGIG